MPPTFSTSSSTSSAPAEAFWTTFHQLPRPLRRSLVWPLLVVHLRMGKVQARAGASNSPCRHVQVKSVMADNTPQNASLMTYANVSGYPTVYAYRNGKQVAEYTGVSRTAADLERFVKQVFGTVHSPVRGRALGSQKRKDIAGGSRRRHTQTAGPVFVRFVGPTVNTAAVVARTDVNNARTSGPPDASTANSTNAANVVAAATTTE